MIKDFVKERITYLRMEEDISEYRLSVELGKSKSYINNISRLLSMPSLGELYNICNYFDITMSEFFDEENKNPIEIKETISMLKRFKKSDIILINNLLDRLLQNEEGNK